MSVGTCCGNIRSRGFWENNSCFACYCRGAEARRYSLYAIFEVIIVMFILLVVLDLALAFQLLSCLVYGVYDHNSSVVIIATQPVTFVLPMICVQRV